MANNFNLNTVNNKEDNLMENTNTFTALANSNSDNFTMQELMNIVGQSTMTVNSVGKQMGLIVSRMDSIESEINTWKSETKSKFDDTKERLDNLEYRSEVTTAQAKTIRKTAGKRIRDILGNGEEYSKYSSMFFARLYSEAKEKGGLGEQISTTCKGDFPKVIDFIEAWTPACGISDLKEYADLQAKQRKNAKDKGYI